MCEMMEGSIENSGDAVRELMGLLDGRADFFRVDGCPAFVIRPAAGEVGPWVWYAPMFDGALPDTSHVWMFSRFLEQGIAIAGVDVGESCGASGGRAVYTRLYETLCSDYGFEEKPCLLAQSRGALMLYNWAVENPHRVGSMAGIFPLCDMRWFYDHRMVCAAYGLSSVELEQRIDELGPLGRLRPLAEAGVPVMHIQGDEDRFVPLGDNSEAFSREYEALGGDMYLIIVPGRGHEVIPEFFQNQRLVDFVVETTNRTN